MSDETATNDDVANSDTTFDSGHFRTILGHFPTGVTVITAMAPGNSEDAADTAATSSPVGFTIGSFTSVSLDPPLVGFLPQLDSDTMDGIEASGNFCVNILSDQQSDLCWKFAKSGTDATRFAGVAWHLSPGGSPILDRAVAWIDCSIEEIHTMGDHLFVLGRVGALDADADHDGEPPVPLLFFKGSLGGFEAAG